MGRLLHVALRWVQRALAPLGAPCRQARRLVGAPHGHAAEVSEQGLHNGGREGAVRREGGQEVG